jgi:hypothetical protein
LHANGIDTSTHASTIFLTLTWALQLIIGFIGLAFAGREAIGLVKTGGLKRLPANFWHLIRAGTTPTADDS